jgi:DNA (cytosine-5)-methyltransferase 1
MKYLSVCSGIEAATVAWHPLGWEPVAFSEIEKFPSQVLAHHYPTVPNWGDMTKFQEWPDADVDVLVGGTPCQSFSVAGLRKGLADPRGNLMLTYLAIADRYRPRWLVWENVPGVLSSHGGRDFGAFLGALGELGYGFAYRVLDAQYFGVAQRRRRVFVVGYLGGWRRAAAVLFERESLSGNPAPGREAGQRIANALTGRADRGGTNSEGQRLIPMVSPALKARDCKGPSSDGDGDGAPLIPCITHSLRGEGFDASEDGTGRGTPLVPVVAPCLTSNYGKQPHSSDTSAGPMLVPVHAFDARQSHVIQYGDKTGPLDTHGHSVAVAFSCKDHGADAGPISPTLRSMNHDGSHANGGGQVAVMYNDTFTNEGVSHASTQKTHAGTLLRALQKEVGAEAFAKWGLGILDSLLPAQVLQSALHGSGIRYPAFSRRWLVYHALSRPEAHSEGIVRAMRETECEGCPSQGWRPPEQLARELGAYLSELSQPGAQSARFMRDLRQAAEGAGVLQQALSAVQEMGRSTRGEGQPEHAAMQIRRLTCEEAEFLQGFPRGYTDIRPNGKPTPDGPRYKALGNSMAVPCMSWIGQRIRMVDA